MDPEPDSLSLSFFGIWKAAVEFRHKSFPSFLIHVALMRSFLPRAVADHRHRQSDGPGSSSLLTVQGLFLEQSLSSRMFHVFQNFVEIGPRPLVPCCVYLPLTNEMTVRTTNENTEVRAHPDCTDLARGECIVIKVKAENQKTCHDIHTLANTVSTNRHCRTECVDHEEQHQGTREMSKRINQYSSPLSAGMTFHTCDGIDDKEFTKANTRCRRDQFVKCSTQDVEKRIDTRNTS